MDFTQVKHREEIILWRGNPSFIVYLSKDLAALIGLFAWLLIIIFSPWIVSNMANVPGVLLPATYVEEVGVDSPEMALRTTALSLALMVFSFPLLLVFLIVLFAPINCLLNYLDEDYALTDQRVILCKGAIRTKIISFYYDDIQNLELQVNSLENALEVGTIKIYSGKIQFEGGWAQADKDWLVAIPKAKTVYKIIDTKATKQSQAEYF